MTPDLIAMSGLPLTSCPPVAPSSSITLTPVLAAAVPFIGLILAYVYDRGRRYNYLADRWNALMIINIDEPDFFDDTKTVDYQTFDTPKRVKYGQHARVYWAAVEDIIRNDYPFELLRTTFVDIYADTIKDCIRLHHSWLRDNIGRLFTNPKFRRQLNKKFAQDLAAVHLNLA
jgi:hypothetical protein